MTFVPTLTGFRQRDAAARRLVKAPEQELDGHYRAHARKLRGYAQRRVGSQEAEDLVHDVYVRLLQQGEVAALERPREYLYRIAENLAIDSARKVRTRSRFANEDIEFLTLQTRVPNPEEIVDGMMKLRLFHAFVDELPAGRRKAFLLNRVNGLTHEEIAQRLGVSVRTVERNIAKALKELRRRLARDISAA
jgi:RNA polymerase sigma factor (sigma-70 family)